MRWNLAGGMSQSRRRTNSSALSTSVTPFFVTYAYFPSSRRESRDSAMGPRAPYLQSLANPSLSFSPTAVPAWSENFSHRHQPARATAEGALVVEVEPLLRALELQRLEGALRLREHPGQHRLELLMCTPQYEGVDLIGRKFYGSIPSDAVPMGFQMMASPGVLPRE